MPETTRSRSRPAARRRAERPSRRRPGTGRAPRTRARRRPPRAGADAHRARLDDAEDRHPARDAGRAAGPPRGSRCTTACAVGSPVASTWSRRSRPWPRRAPRRRHRPARRQLPARKPRPGQRSCTARSSSSGIVHCATRTALPSTDARPPSARHRQAIGPRCTDGPNRQGSSHGSQRRIGPHRRRRRSRSQQRHQERHLPRHRAGLRGAGHPPGVGGPDPPRPGRLSSTRAT